MSYHTYNTEGLILDTKPTGETSQYVYLFTRELGLVGAHAQNTRHISSKLRYALDAPARSIVSLVRGKNMWRLISAIPEKSFFAAFRDNDQKQIISTRVFFLIKKLLAGEESNRELFDLVNGGLDFLEKGIEAKNTEQIKNFEAIIILRILHLLGYVPEIEQLKKYYETSDWNGGVINDFTSLRREAIRVINDSIRESGL